MKKSPRLTTQDEPKRREVQNNVLTQPATPPKYSIVRITEKLFLPLMFRFFRIHFIVRNSSANLIGFRLTHDLNNMRTTSSMPITWRSCDNLFREEFGNPTSLNIRHELLS
jgi:hypothetical protein